MTGPQFAPSSSPFFPGNAAPQRARTWPIVRIAALVIAVIGLVTIGMTLLPLLTVEAPIMSPYAYRYGALLGNENLGSVSVSTGFYDWGASQFAIAWIIPLAASVSLVLASAQAIRGYSHRLMSWTIGILGTAIVVGLVNLIAPPINSITSTLRFRSVSVADDFGAATPTSPGAGLIASVLLLLLGLIIGIAALMYARFAHRRF